MTIHQIETQFQQTLCQQGVQATVTITPGFASVCVSSLFAAEKAQAIMAGVTNATHVATDHYAADGDMPEEWYLRYEIQSETESE
jgi:hypothetical protein